MTAKKLHLFAAKNAGEKITSFCGKKTSLCHSSTKNTYFATKNKTNQPLAIFLGQKLVFCRKKNISTFTSFWGQIRLVFCSKKTENRL
jgi:hypothetical protein